MVETTELEALRAAAARAAPPKGMLVTDLDGTLFGSSRSISGADRAALERLGAEGYLRIVATGRNPQSFLRAVGDDLPIDYAVLASGAAVLDYRSRRFVRIVSLEPHEVWTAGELLLDLDLDLMILDPLPDRPSFACHPSSNPCPDYWKRIDIYREHARPLKADGALLTPAEIRSLWTGNALELLAIDPNDSGRNAHRTVKERLSGYTVLRATSPLGGQATWIEVFHASVSKSLTSAWLAAHFGLEARDVLAIGNDYNDLDLLEWGGMSFVVANAPQDMRERFPVVASSDAGGVAEAVARWRPARKG